MQKTLNKIVEKLSRAAQANLECVTLYGSAATGDFQPGRSDLNLLCVLRRIDSAELRKLRSPARWWARKGHPALLFLTLQDLSRAADVFAIELLEIKSNRRVLYGPDVFQSIEVPMTLHRQQVERELRHSLNRLRQGYVAVAGNRKAVQKLMVKSFSTFSLLFQHALVALGEPPQPAKEDAVKRLAALLNFDSGSFVKLAAIRREKTPEKGLDFEDLFDNYLNAITQVVDEVDRRFEALDRLRST